jgi:hypothetical protein
MSMGDVRQAGSKKIADSEVKIVPLADSSWINLKKISFFVSFFKKKEMP